MKKKFKSQQHWTWILIVSFFILGIIDIRFGVLGFLCMLAPIYHALRGRGKVHCSKFCPRGSFLGKFLSKISFNNALPKFMKTKAFKTLVLLQMMIMFTISMASSNFELAKIGYALLRLMSVSFIVGIVLGIFFKPRSWCQICPMGYGTELISKGLDKKNQEDQKEITC